MLNYSNPYDVLSETISFENVQLMGEMITLKTLRTRYAYARKALDWLYVGLVIITISIVFPVPNFENE